MFDVCLITTAGRPLTWEEKASQIWWPCVVALTSDSTTNRVSQRTSWVFQDWDAETNNHVQLCICMVRVFCLKAGGTVCFWQCSIPCRVRSMRGLTDRPHSFSLSPCTITNDFHQQAPSPTCTITNKHNHQNIGCALHKPLHSDQASEGMITTSRRMSVGYMHSNAKSSHCLFASRVPWLASLLALHHTDRHLDGR